MGKSLCNVGCDDMVDGLKIEERSIKDPSVLDVLKQIDAHQRDMTKCLENLTLKLDGLAKAFPDGDVDAHRQYHLIAMENLAEKKKLRLAIQEKTISGLIWAGLVAVGLAVFHELQSVLIKR